MDTQVFDTDHLAKTYFKMALPVVLGLAITLIYNLADTFFIAQTGNTDLVAGVALCGPVFTTLMAFGNIYGQGGSSLISRLLGKQDTDGIRRVSAFCFYIAIITGAVIGALMLIFQTPLLRLIGADADTLPYARDYFTILALGAPATVLCFIHSNLIRCEGKATLSMIGSASGTVLNMILDPILISGFHMGARGAAIATVVGYLFSDIFFIIIVSKKSKILSIAPKFRISRDFLQQILGVGITAAITNLMSSLCMITLNHFLLPYGNEKIAAMGIVLKINMIASLVLTGFAFGGVPLYGFLYGANNKEKLGELIRFCLNFLGGLALTLSAVLFIAAPFLIRSFMDQGSIVADGTLMLRWQVTGTVFTAVVLLITVLFQATGKVIPALLMSVSRQGIVFMVVLFLAVTILGYNGVIMAQALADVLSAVFALVLYRKVLGSQN